MVHDDGQPIDVQVVQVWIRLGPARTPGNDKELRAYMLRRARTASQMMIRYNSLFSFVIFPPPIFSDGEWLIRVSWTSRVMDGKAMTSIRTNWTGRT